MNKAAQLRKLLSEKSILKVMGAHNALGAKLIEAAGFDAVWSSGFEIATAHGVPDADFLSRAENLSIASIINAATKLPVICDCDTGYGTASHAMHLVKQYESAGLAAVVIEDKRFPKVNSFIPGRQELAKIEEFVGKLEAMKAARSSEDGILIFARIEALIAGWGVEEAYRRAVAYKEAGADGLVIHSKSKKADEIFAFAQIWNKNYKDTCPLIAIPTTYPGVTAEELAANGFKIAIYANQGIRASIRAMKKVMTQIVKDGTTQNIEQEISPMDEVFALQGMADFQENEKQFGDKITAVIPAAADHKSQPELASLLENRPLCMVPIAGKSLLSRQLEILSSVGISDFRVVTGYQKEIIESAYSKTLVRSFLGHQAKLIYNDEYAVCGSASSLMRGLLDCSGKTLVCYSDIIWGHSTLLQDLLPNTDSITIVIDKGYKSLPRRDKQLDLVITKSDSNEDPYAAALRGQVRNLQSDKIKIIESIGKNISKERAGYEFIGMMLLSKEGVKALSSLWRDAQSEFYDKKFFEADNIRKASVTDLLQHAINKGMEIRGFVIEHGWSELYSREDYDRLERYFSEKTRDLAMQP